MVAWGENSSVAPAMRNSFWYWRTMAFLGSTRMRIIISSSTGSMATVTGTPNWPMLLAQAGYAGTNGIRVMIPIFVPFSLMNVGDADCSGAVDISDVVYLITYIFQGGPPPGDPNNDGIPDC